MNRKILRLPLVVVLGILVWLGISSLTRSEPMEIRSELQAVKVNLDGFTRASAPQVFEFPIDHGPHPDYLTEWWYYTGNLDSPDGDHFGYQLTFFRRALAPIDQRNERASTWATDQIYFAHFTITDVAGNSHQAFERFSRGAAGLAGAQGEPVFKVWLEDWQVEQIDPGRYKLYASQAGLTLDLELFERKAPVLQGDRGYSQKGPDPGNASYYYSLTALETVGQITFGEVTTSVSGNSWMDHEFSTSALSGDQIGWDWFSIQLEDQSELMFFQIRREDGSIDPFSSGTLIDPNGKSTALEQSEFTITVNETWESPNSGTVYPAAWTVEIPSADITLEILPYLADQELIVSFIYWEGAVRVSGKRGTSPVQGSGYVEMTGYRESIAGQF